MRYCPKCRKSHSGTCKKGKVFNIAQIRRDKLLPNKKKMVAEMQRNRCIACKRITLKGEVNHKNPLYFGGNNDFSNLEYLCLECHRKVTAREREKFKIYNKNKHI